MVLSQSKNPHSLQYIDLIGIEQQFNTLKYGIKGNIDATVLLKTHEGKELKTALEIKTGKHKTAEYDG